MIFCQFFHPHQYFFQKSFPASKSFPLNTFPFSKMFSLLPCSLKSLSLFPFSKMFFFLSRSLNCFIFCHKFRYGSLTKIVSRFSSESQAALKAVSTLVGHVSRLVCKRNEVVMMFCPCKSIIVFANGSSES